MAYLNKVMLIGNIGKEPSIKAMSNGRKNASFSLATSRRYRDNNGEQKEQTEWHNIVAWGKTVDIIEQLGITKGMTLYVEGTLTNRSWTDQTTGQKKYTTEVMLDNFQLLTPRGQSNNGSQQYGAGHQNPYSRNNNSSPAERQIGMGADMPPAGGDPEEDLPF